MDNYEIKEFIGKGKFASVFRGTNLKTGKIVAIKIIPSGNMKEVEILQRLNLLSDYFFDQNKNLVIVTEYLPGVTLQRFMIQNNKSELPSDVLWNLIFQLLLNLKRIHDSDIAHGDIKADNIIIDQNLKIQIIDFGLSCVKQDGIIKDFGHPIFKTKNGIYIYKELTFEEAKLIDLNKLKILIYYLCNLDMYPFRINRNNNISTDKKEDNFISNYKSDYGRTNEFLKSYDCAKNIDELIGLFEKIIG